MRSRRDSHWIQYPRRHRRGHSIRQRLLQVHWRCYSAGDTGSTAKKAYDAAVKAWDDAGYRVGDPNDRKDRRPRP